MFGKAMYKKYQKKEELFLFFATNKIRYYSNYETKDFYKKPINPNDLWIIFYM